VFAIKVLKEDITPVIQKLKDERSAFIEYQKIEREYAHLHKICTAHQFYVCELNELEAKFKEIQKEEAKINSKVENINSVVKSDKKRKNEIDKMINDVSLILNCLTFSKKKSFERITN
jgi:structural maintenance of chromosome 2